MRFRSCDYGRADLTADPVGGHDTLGDQVRDDLEGVLHHRPAGEVRMLSQLRHLGWLFNPITVFLAWDADPERPVGAVLEVTNTPWKERHRYPVALARHNGHFRARFPKALHVSPFLDEAFDYVLTIDDRDDRVVVALDVVASADDVGAVLPDDGAAEAATVSTRLDVGREAATRDSLAAALRAVPLSTHRVSAGIHLQALALWRKRVPFVPHPSKRPSTDHRRLAPSADHRPRNETHR